MEWDLEILGIAVPKGVVLNQNIRIINLNF